MDVRELILRSGGRVRASGRVVSLDDAVWFEPPLPQNQPLYPPGQEPAPCRSGYGVGVTGVDVRRLDRRRDKDGAVEGYARLTGTWLGDHLVADLQEPPVWHSPVVPEWKLPPCPAPAGGWPHQARRLEGPSEQECAALGITCVVTFRPSPSQAVLVLAAERPQQARKVLGPRYGERLCVVPSRWSQAQLKAVTEQADMVEQWLAYKWMMTATADGQVLVTIDVVHVLPAFAQWMTTTPDGLIRVRAWLTPVT
ncbi:hypothetical protein [Actinomadura sp. 6N118]|uniref:hypothetical protein n=1 Tax=Actinomadura sp. 6N118 TaxID=3375151 RepID=UPI003789DD7E